MKLIVTKDYKKMSLKAAELIAQEIRENPKLRLGLATGSSPIGCYEELIRLNKEDQLDFSQVVSFNLDEYLGLAEDHPQSYHYFMNTKLFEHINIRRDACHIPRGDTLDPQLECRDYDMLIQSNGGIDLQLLGIGSNGHIAFNEPADRLNLASSLVDLSSSTIEDNSRFFDNKSQVPRQALSMGVGNILKARKIILLASGSSKKKIINRLVTMEYVTTQLPASFLLLHPDLTIIVDEEAWIGVDK